MFNKIEMINSVKVNAKKSGQLYIWDVICDDLGYVTQRVLCHEIRIY